MNDENDDKQQIPTSQQNASDELRHTVKSSSSGHLISMDSQAQGSDEFFTKETEMTSSPSGFIINDNIHMSQQVQLPQSDLESDQPTALNVATDKKIKFWRIFALVCGLISFCGYIVALIAANILAHEAQSAGWVIIWIFGLFVQRGMLFLLILAIIALVRIIVLSAQAKSHAFKNYAVAVMGIALVFSPFAISEVLSFFRISWNNDGGVSVSVKSKDPYYVTHSSSSSVSCMKGSHKTSNDLKNIDIDEYYSYVDDPKRRKEFAAESYIETIGEETLCQVAEFYKVNKRYPGENEISDFATKAISDDVRAGVYGIELEVGLAPNKKDFTILFDRTCTNQESDEGNVVVLSPLYGEEGRYCVYDKIDDLVENLGKTRI